VLKQLLLLWKRQKKYSILHRNLRVLKLIRRSTLMMESQDWRQLMLKLEKLLQDKFTQDIRLMSRLSKTTSSK
jgi:hypothetical protein